MYSLPSPDGISTLLVEKKVEVLAHLFEPCSTLAELLTNSVMYTDFESYRHFIEACRSFLINYLHEEEKKETVLPKVAKIIAAHPRLGPSKDKLSSHSSAEQKTLVGNEEEAQKLAVLNELYEKTFPGLRYVVFVAGRSRESIMENMKSRISRANIVKEREEAFNAMCDIALDRASKLGAKL